MTPHKTDSTCLDEQIEKLFRRNEYDSHPDEIDHDIELHGNYLYIEFHEPPKWKQRQATK